VAVGHGGGVALGRGLAYAVTRADVPGKRSWRSPAACRPSCRRSSRRWHFSSRSRRGLVVRAFGGARASRASPASSVARPWPSSRTPSSSWSRPSGGTDDASRRRPEPWRGARSQRRAGSRSRSRGRARVGGRSRSSSCACRTRNPFLIGAASASSRPRSTPRRRRQNLGGAAALSVPLIVRVCCARAHHRLARCPPDRPGGRSTSGRAGPVLARARPRRRPGGRERPRRSSL